MVGNYKVITLCGSTRFKEAFLEAQKRLTLEGNIVISVGLFGHSGNEEVWIQGTKEMLDDMHKRKIDMADEIFVINVDGYIGSSTQSEIEYAKATGKTVRYLVDETSVFVPKIDLDVAFEMLKQRWKDVDLYRKVMSMAKDPANPEFQRKYDRFYRVRRNEAWRKEYFRLMGLFQKQDQVSFGDILQRLYQATGQIEASFSSKMLATLDANMPIWDSRVLKMLKLKLLEGKLTEERLSNTVEVYDRICRWYKTFMKTDVAKNWIHRFDCEFPEFADFRDAKKIDFILWAG